MVAPSTPIKATDTTAAAAAAATSNSPVKKAKTDAKVSFATKTDIPHMIEPNTAFVVVCGVCLSREDLDRIVYVMDLTPDKPVVIKTFVTTEEIDHIGWVYLLCLGSSNRIEQAKRILDGPKFVSSSALATLAPSYTDLTTATKQDPMSNVIVFSTLSMQEVQSVVQANTGKPMTLRRGTALAMYKDDTEGFCAIRVAFCVWDKDTEIEFGKGTIFYMVNPKRDVYKVELCLTVLGSMSAVLFLLAKNCLKRFVSAYMPRAHLCTMFEPSMSNALTTTYTQLPSIAQKA